MPSIPCPASISCEGSDYPVSNFSSEDPDFEAFLGNFIRVEPPPLGQSWNHAWCYGTCVSYVSQEDADLCAERMAILCASVEPVDPRTGDGGGGPAGDGGGGGPPTQPQDDPPTGTKPNEEQTWEIPCPNGGDPSSYTVPAGIYVDRSQSVANMAALQLAQRRAAENYLCCPDLTAYQCKGDVLDAELALIGANPPFELTITGLPPGMYVEVYDNFSAYVGGTVDTPGTYEVSTTIQDSKGNHKTCQATIQVMGVTNVEEEFGFLPEGTIGVAYSFQFITEGGEEPLTYGVDPSFPLPTGLTISPTGLISGTYSGAPISQLSRIVITDALGNTCTQDVTLTFMDFIVLGTPPNGTECVAYPAFSFTASIAGCTFSGTAPPGLVINADGSVTGTPTASGTQNFNVTADDGSGHTANLSVDITVADDASGVARSVADLVWSLTGSGDYAAGHSVLTGQPVAGSCHIEVSIDAFGGTGTVYRTWEARLGKCLAQGNYSVNYSSGGTFSRGAGATTAVTASFILLSNNHIVASSATSDFGPINGSHVLSVSSPGADNMKIAISISGNPGVADPTLCTFDVEFTPATPP